MDLDTTEVSHCSTAQPDAEIVAPTSPNMYTRDTTPNKKTLQPNSDNSPTSFAMAKGSWFSKRDKIMAQFYSFRDGQYPYTALFVSFAPASKEQAATGGEAPTATSNESCKMGANAAAACKILVK